jgi:hypothetical protein
VFHYEQDLPRLSGRTTPCTALSLSLGSRSSRKTLQTSKHMHTKKVWLGLWLVWLLGSCLFVDDLGFNCCVFLFIVV